MTSLGRFHFRPSRLQRAVLSPFQFPDLFPFLSGKLHPTPPFPPEALRPRPLPFPSLLHFKGELGKPSGLRRPPPPPPPPPTPRPGGPPGAAGNPFSCSLALRGPRERNLDVMASRGENLHPERPLSMHDGKTGRGGVCRRLGPALGGRSAVHLSARPSRRAGGARGPERPGRRAAARGRCAHALAPRHAAGGPRSQAPKGPSRPGQARGRQRRVPALQPRPRAASGL